MRKWFIVFGLCLMLALSSCGTVRESIIDLSESDIKNVNALKEATVNLMETWPFYSGLIRGALGPRIADLPVSTLVAMDELDIIAKEQEWDAYTLGYSLGLRIQMLSDLVKKALEMYAPDVLELVPLLL